MIFFALIILLQSGKVLQEKQKINLLAPLFQ